MRLDDDARVFISWDAEITADPTGSTVELEVDSTRYAATWQASPVVAGTVWRQTARTTKKFCGTSATAGSDIGLTAGPHPAQWIVTMPDGQVLPATGFRIDVQ